MMSEALQAQAQSCLMGLAVHFKVLCSPLVLLWRPCYAAIARVQLHHRLHCTTMLQVVEG